MVFKPPLNRPTFCMFIYQSMYTITHTFSLYAYHKTNMLFDEDNTFLSESLKEKKFGRLIHFSNKTSGLELSKVFCTQHLSYFTQEKVK